MITPKFIQVPVFNADSPDKPTIAWLNPFHFIHVEDRGDYTAAHLLGGNAYHILIPLRELMPMIDPEWRG
ncbi:MAG: hypothetical protein R3B68_02605 [Phycisphaerales bacterium]